MSTSTHQIAIKGVDKTAQAFQSIQSRAAAAGSRIASVVGGAIAAAGAYMSFRAVKSGVDELGKLSDVAQRTGANVADLTRTVTALQVLGINTDIDSLAKSFQFMERNTGRTGLQGFYESIEELRGIPDLAERSEAAMKIFGRSGMELMPLVNASNNSVQALKDVGAAMGGVPQAAAEAGDRAADAMTIASSGIKGVWLQVVAAIVGFFDGRFVGGLRGAAMTGMAYLEYFVKVAGRYARTFGENWGKVFNNIVEAGAWAMESLLRFMGSMLETGAGMMAEMVTGTFRNLFMGEDNDMSFSAMFSRRGGDEAVKTLAERMRGAMEMAGATLSQTATDDLEARLQARLEAIPKAAQAAEAGLPRTEARQVGTEAGKAAGEAAAKAASRISNQLIMGGSNAATKLGLLGPQWQSEQKKQTELLKDIKANTAKSAENSGKTTYEATDLGA